MRALPSRMPSIFRTESPQQQDPGVSSLLLGPWLYSLFHFTNVYRGMKILTENPVPGWVRNLAAWLLAQLDKDDILPCTVRAAGTKTVQEFYGWVRKRDEYARVFCGEVSAFCFLVQIYKFKQIIPTLYRSGESTSLMESSHLSLLCLHCLTSTCLSHFFRPSHV